MSDERSQSEQPTHRPRAVPIDPTQMGLSEFYRPDEDEGTSLTDLSGAYAELINSGEDPYQAVESEESAIPIEEAEHDLQSTQPVSVAVTAEEEAELSPRSILEAMLFVGDPTGQPLEAAKVASLMRGVSSQEIDELVTELNGTYDEVGSVFEIRREDAGYVMGLRHEHEQMRERFYGRVRETKLSQVAIDVLAAVSYTHLTLPTILLV